MDTIRITGVVSQKNTSTSVDEIINNTITIQQSNISNKRPAIAGISFTGKYP